MKNSFVSFFSILSGIMAMSAMSLHMEKAQESIMVPGQSIVVMSQNQMSADIKSILTYEDNFILGVHYPSTGYPLIDSRIENEMLKLIETFKSVLPKGNYNELNVDYELLRYNEKMFSVVFKVYTILSGETARVDIITMTFNTGENKLIGLDALFAKNARALDSIAGKCREALLNEPGANRQLIDQGASAIAENYQAFAIDYSNLYIYFAPGKVTGGAGIKKITLPLSALQNVLELPGKPQKQLSEKRLSPLKPQPKSEVDYTRPMVALTFDDGPSPAITGQILDILKEKNAKATFFVVGNRVKNYPDTIRRIYDDGHEIGNHSYDHKLMTKLSEEDIVKEIMLTNEAVKEIVGIEPQCYRPPYGGVDKHLMNRVNMPVIMWSMDPRDWECQNTQTIVRRVNQEVKDGDIIIMHDLYPSSAEAVGVFVQELQEKGFQFVTVQDLLFGQGDIPISGKIYKKR